MTGHLAAVVAAPLPAAAAAADRMSGGETLAFCVLGGIALLGALGVVLARSAVHAGLLLGLVMLALGVVYGVQDAQFLMFVQLIVYAGAVMSLFLFVLMLVGVDSSDSLVETLRGQKPAAVALGLGFVALLAAGLGGALRGVQVAGLGDANAEGNVFGLARLLFTRYVFAFEVTSALLITAALAAMVLTHREKVGPTVTQKQRMQQRFQGPRPSPLPGPGVFARSNAVGTPALLPDGSVAQESLPATVTRNLAARGGLVRPDALTPGGAVPRLGAAAPATATHSRPRGTGAGEVADGDQAHDPAAAAGGAATGREAAGT